MKVLYLTLAIVLFDQGSKLWVKGFALPFLGFRHDGMFYGEQTRILGDILQFTFVENPGMAFGLDLSPYAKLAVSIFSIVASIGLFWYLYHVREQNLGMRIGLAAILGGAVGNLIDRTFYSVFYGYDTLFYGKVVDFIQVEFFDFTLFGKRYDHWPIFNVADIAVTVGVLLLLIFYKKSVQQHDEAKRKEAAAQQPESSEDQQQLESSEANTDVSEAKTESPEAKAESIPDNQPETPETGEQLPNQEETKG